MPEIGQQQRKRAADAAAPTRRDQQIDRRHRRQDDQLGADEIGEILADDDRAPRDRPREQIRDRPVLDFVGDQRRAVERAQHRNDESQIQQPDHPAENHGARPPARR